MDPRVAAKLARHAREGVTYPNRGSGASLSPEVARFQEKLARHQAEGAVQSSEPEAKPKAKAAEPTTKTETKAPSVPPPPIPAHTVESKSFKR
jgi:hypothetical protein